MPSNACTIKSILTLHTYIPGVFFLISCLIGIMFFALDVRYLGKMIYCKDFVLQPAKLSEEEDGKIGFIASIKYQVIVLVRYMFLAITFYFMLE